MSNNKVRIAVINPDKCRPKKCNFECKKSCVVNKIGKICVEIEDIAKINESLCIGCNQCVSKCPFNAIRIINLPSQIANDLVYSYGENLFKLYKLPNPKSGRITGIIGPNGCGKSTILNILSSVILPNFDKDIIKKEDVLKHVRGLELQKYLTLLYNDKLIINYKRQNITALVKNLKNANLIVRDIITKYSNFIDYEKIVNTLDINKMMNNNVMTLSGGELQKLVIATTLMKEGNVYIFDEPTNYLDIECRIKVANLIKDLNGHDKYVFVVDHDLSFIDFIADYIHIMFGEPGAYGCVSSLYTTSEGINIYFDGYIPADNIRFRAEPYKLNELYATETTEQLKNTYTLVNYSEHIIEFNNYNLTIKEGNIMNTTNMIIVLGKNAVGKSTYINYLKNISGFTISHKSQLANNYTHTNSTVRELVYNQIKESMMSSMFVTDVVNMLGVNKIFDKKVKKLSGGEKQRLNITLCLGKIADIYLIDEPSSSLDIEYRFIATKVIKRFLLHNKKIGFIVEHDILMAISLAKEQNSKIIVVDEVKNEDNIKYCETSDLLDFNIGINKFLKSINTTFRIDQNNKRPKINKLGSVLDCEQKLNNIYYQ